MPNAVPPANQRGRRAWRARCNVEVGRVAMHHILPAPRRLLGKPSAAVVGGLVMAGIAGIMTLNELESRRLAANPPVPPETRRVIVAARPIARGQAVEAELIDEIELPLESAPADAVASREEIIGKLARSAIYADDVLTNAKFLDTHATSALSGLIPAGRRAISIKVNEVTGIAGFVAPGSHVDVMLSLSERDDEPPRTVTIVQDTEVLAVAQSTADHNGQPMVVDTVTLNVTPRQAEVIATASREGEIHMALRNARDDTRTWSAGISLDELMDGRTIEPTTVGVELIRGIERVAFTF